MSEETKTASKKPESKPKATETTADSKPSAKDSQNGKGDAPRNNLSESFRKNFEAIDWSK